MWQLRFLFVIFVMFVKPVWQLRFLFVMFVKPTSTVESYVADSDIRDRQLSGPESLYRSAFSSFTQRHSAEMVKKSRKTHSLCSRFADVLSLECSNHQLSSTMTMVVGSNVQSSATNTFTTATAGFDPLHGATAGQGLVLSSRSLRQFSYAADDAEPPVVAGVHCICSSNVDLPLSLLHRTPGNFPSSLPLSPVAAPSRQPQRPQRRASGQHRVSWTVAVIFLGT